MKRIIISWILVMGVLLLGKFTPLNGQCDITDFLTGFIAGAIGIWLGMKTGE